MAIIGLALIIFVIWETNKIIKDYEEKQMRRIKELIEETIDEKLEEYGLLEIEDS